MDWFNNYMEKVNIGIDYNAIIEAYEAYADAVRRYHEAINRNAEIDEIFTRSDAATAAAGTVYYVGKIFNLTPFEVATVARVRRDYIRRFGVNAQWGNTSITAELIRGMYYNK